MEIYKHVRNEAKESRRESNTKKKSYKRRKIKDEKKKENRNIKVQKKETGNHLIKSDERRKAEKKFL